MPKSKQSQDSIPPIQRDDFFEQSLNGFAIADAKGRILHNNLKLEQWMGVGAGELKGKLLADLLTISGKIYYETHLAPLLRMQGHFDEVLVELNVSSGQKLPVLLNAMERKNDRDHPRFIYYILSKSSDRLQYEQNLQLAKKITENKLKAEKQNVLLREQLIAVLGHDLRNPLNASIMAAEMLDYTATSPENKQLMDVVKFSGYRMNELINNIMDFTRSRLGGGIVIEKRETDLKSLMLQVIAELKVVFRDREIVPQLELPKPISVDPHRISQLFSNLLGNSLSHGAEGEPIYVTATHRKDIFQIRVCNRGEKIPAELQERLFSPFVRNESSSKKGGLGLGLYIAAEIARAHGGTLTCRSTNESTCFVFEMVSP